jgi:hypothetical protein
VAHRTLRSGYDELVDRLNRFLQGAPPSRLLFAILEMLFSAREAELVALLPIRPFSVATAARAWKVSPAAAAAVLDELASRALLLDIQGDDGRAFLLPPPMAGFFEFSMMRLRDDLDQKVPAELFYEYLNVEEDFIRALFTNGETQLGRVFVNEPALEPEISLHALDYERASHVVRSATHIGVGLCYCRHTMEHLGRACDAPLDSVHRTVEMAVERGTLQHLIFDRPALLHHRVLAAVLGAILALPPARRALANHQLRSRYIDALIERFG